MIKKVFFGVAVFFITVVNAEDKILIGDTEIKIPQVEGFQSIGQNHIMYEIMLSFVPPTNELLDIKIENSDIDAEVRGEEPEYKRYIIMQTYIPTKNRPVTKTEFDQLRQFLDTQYDEMTRAIQSKVDEMVEQGSKEISDKYSVEMATKITDNIPLEIYYNQEQRFSAINLMKGDFTIEGVSEPLITTMGVNVLHVKEKVLYLYVYSEADSELDRQWVKDISNNFSNAILEQ